MACAAAIAVLFDRGFGLAFRLCGELLVMMLISTEFMP